jgi:hypothetical protein
VKPKAEADKAHGETVAWAHRFGDQEQAQGRDGERNETCRPIPDR